MLGSTVRNQVWNVEATTVNFLKSHSRCQTQKHDTKSTLKASEQLILL